MSGIRPSEQERLYYCRWVEASFRATGGKEGIVASQTTYSVEIVSLTEEEAVAAFNTLAQREMGISGQEFLRRWDAGEWVDVDLDSVRGLVDVSMGLPLVR
jgi:hypothetical protein